MDRALRLQDLGEALGQHPILSNHSTDPNAGTQWVEGVEHPPWPDVADDWQSPLPTTEELQNLLAETEVQLFLNQRRLPARILRTAWYLHGVASASRATE